MIPEIAEKRYLQQRAQARMRNIPFTLTFEEWWDIWDQSGKWNLRGTKKGQYCMSRIGDVGPYSTSNVFIQLSQCNVRDAHSGKKNSPDAIEKTRLANIGKKRSEKAIEKQRTSMLGKIPWNKGRKETRPEVLVNQSNAHKKINYSI